MIETTPSKPHKPDLGEVVAKVDSILPDKVDSSACALQFAAALDHIRRHASSRDERLTAKVGLMSVATSKYEVYASQDPEKGYEFLRQLESACSHFYDVFQLSLTGKKASESE